MVSIVTQYRCGTCRTLYPLLADAVRCETKSHRARSVWPDPPRATKTAYSKGAI